MTFAKPVSRCAFIATVGDPGAALVFSPSGVYTGSGPDVYTVYIETKNAGGGLQTGVPFHLALICPDTPWSRFCSSRAGARHRDSGLSGQPARGRSAGVRKHEWTLTPVQPLPRGAQ